LNNTQTLDQLVADIEAKAQAQAQERQMKLLSTITGANRMLRKKDGIKLGSIVTKLADVTEKPVFTGFTFNSNVETIVAIANTLQYMKGDLREQVPETIWSIFDTDTRTELLEAYGRLPYLADELAIEVNGESVVIDPEARTRAKEGVKPNVDKLNILVNDVALNMGLLGEYECTEAEANTAWSNAVRKVHKAEVLDRYKDSLEQH